MQALTPPARAKSDSPLRRLSQARWIATAEEEQPVLTTSAGPPRFRQYDRREATSASEAPVKLP